MRRNQKKRNHVSRNLLNRNYFQGINVGKVVMNLKDVNLAQAGAWVKRNKTERDKGRQHPLPQETSGRNEQKPRGKTGFQISPKKSFPGFFSARTSNSRFQGTCYAPPFNGSLVDYASLFLQ